MPKGKQRIYSVKDKGLNDQERLDLARLLIKAGYVVKIGREKPSRKSSYMYYVEYWEDEVE